MFMMEDPTGGRESLVMIMGEDVMHGLLRLGVAWVLLLPWTTAAAVLVFVGVWVGKRLTAAKCTSSRRMDGKTVIITGGESGLGKEVAKDLVDRGADVIIAGINKNKAYETRDELAAKEGTVEVAYLDVSSMASVRRFAKTMEGRKIDVLLNNAGVADLPRRITNEGLEFTVATNHLGHFLLTHLLMPGLKEARGKVITVASICHKRAKHEEDLDLKGDLRFCYEREVGMLEIYGATKAMNILFSSELSRRLKGTGVTSNCLNPGSSKTDIFNNLTNSHWYGPFIKLYVLAYAKTITEGAQTSIHVAVSEGVDGVSGKYFEDCKEAEPSELVQDEGIARKLWEISERLVQLQPHEKTI
ncbi:retinol dehydrogenase 12-like [Penaeus japonicus]|uniref:retinol dehydrogenase 12-like n=1 Tax=Penaeus japonicus TaxID=27405 RepID=UPI001C70D0BD|nr:retinol dehydrogenase 12-like [Penaeus japonicus]